jgi:hypothetical protein
VSHTGVTFILSQSAAAIIECSGGCRFSMGQCCLAEGHDKSDMITCQRFVMLLSLGNTNECTYSVGGCKSKAVHSQSRNTRFESLLVGLLWLRIGTGDGRL